MSRESGGYN